MRHFIAEFCDFMLFCIKTTCFMADLSSFNHLLFEGKIFTLFSVPPLNLTNMIKYMDNK